MTKSTEERVIRAETKIDSNSEKFNNLQVSLEKIQEVIQHLEDKIDRHHEAMNLKFASKDMEKDIRQNTRFRLLMTGALLLFSAVGIGNIIIMAYLWLKLSAL